MAHVGVSADVVAAMVRICDASLDSDDGAEGLCGVGFESLASIWHQRHSQRVRKTAHLHRGKAQEYAARWRNGESLLAVSRSCRFAPVLLARLVVEIVCNVPKRRVGELVRAPASISDARLRGDVSECVAHDAHCAPRHDASRLRIGIEYELLLQDHLERRAIPFEHEDDLRLRGFAKTPDVLLVIPLGVTISRADLPLGSQAGASSAACETARAKSDDLAIVNWIDSKAMFGSPDVFESEHEAQLLSYVNRLGPGAVIYWFGFASSLQARHPDVLVLDAWPEEGHVIWPHGEKVAPSHQIDAFS
ncbi:hypothetical protein M885DRAFT_571438 [Pelagophyceae sp. CCMP2097]|nr:hypothetical protein M885DRAFT_571438 [Pelagophyceae sp. CCMP2097]